MKCKERLTDSSAGSPQCTYHLRRQLSVLARAVLRHLGPRFVPSERSVIAGYYCRLARPSFHADRTTLNTDSSTSPVLSTCYNHFIPMGGVGEKGAY